DQEAERAEVPLARRGLLRVEDRAGRRLHVERVERPAVDRALRVDQQLEGDAAGGDRLRESAVDRPFHLGRRALEVELHLVTGDVDPKLDLDRTVAETVVVEEAVGLVRPVGKRSDRFSLELLGLAVNLVARREVGLVPEAVEDRLEAFLARAARR